MTENATLDARPVSGLTVGELRELLAAEVREAVGATPDELLLIGDVAKLCKVSTKTVRRWAEAGIIPPPVKTGGSPRWVKSALMDCFARIAAEAEAEQKRAVIP